MALNLSTDALFNIYFNHVIQTTLSLEAFFEIKGLSTQMLGMQIQHQGHFYSFDDEEENPEEVAAREHVKASRAWRSLSSLFEYAVDGALPEGASSNGPNVRGMVKLFGVDQPKRVLQLTGADKSEDWQHIIAMADGRYALDAGDELTVEQLALLAKVDERTVRNAISAGSLLADKLQGETRVMNTSARNWLSSRRGFKATRSASTKTEDLNAVNAPTEFAAFMLARRTMLGIDGDPRNGPPGMHPSVNSKTISEIEDGVFKLPIDVAFPLADYYQLDRREFLACVMRLFFRAEFLALEQSFKAAL